MASAGSVSESMQMSILLQGQPDVIPGRPKQQRGVGFCKQVLLVLSVSGMEMCLTFEQIYQVLILQYLGVPLSLVSINGVFCGLTSMAIIPVVGIVTDGGSNPKRRKMISLFVGMSFFLIGLVLLLVSAVVKLSILEDILDHVGTDSSLSTPASVWSYNSSLFVNVTNHNSSFNVLNQSNDTTRVDGKSADVSNEVPLTAYLAICGFAFVDIGYDSCMPINRAYILESVPTFQHVQLLVMATLVQASSGTVFSLLGVMDISDALGNAFHVDGTGAVLIFFCTFLFVAVTCGFVSTTLTGHFLTKVPTYRETETRQLHRASRETPELPRRQRLRSYRSHIHGTDSTDSLKYPILQEDKLTNNYSAISKISSVTNSHTSLEDGFKPRMVTDSRRLHTSVSFEDSTFGEAKQAAYSSPVPELDESHASEDSLAVFNKTERVETDQRQNPPTDVPKHVSVKEFGASQDREKTKMKKRLVILSISTFLTFGASMSFVYYAANAVTLGIFHGDPLALPGTKGKELYDQGLWTAALGNLSFYIVFTIVSLINGKLIEVAGEKMLFIIFQLIYTVPLTALVATRCLEAYFATVATVGIFRNTVYTIPFVMASKITQETGEGKTNLGKTMSLIGFLVPAHYIIISAFMGPVLDATGNVWIPLVYSLGCVCLSMAVFSFLFLVK